MGTSRTCQVRCTRGSSTPAQCGPVCIRGLSPERPVGARAGHTRNAQASTVTAPRFLSGPAARTNIAAGFHPLKIIEVELCNPLPAIDDDGTYQRAWVLVRLLTEPIGACVVDIDPGGLTPDRLGEVLWRELGEALVSRFEAADLAAPPGLTGGGLDTLSESWPFLQRRGKAFRSAPSISVVICTYNRPDRLKVCLKHMQRQHYPAYEVIVVDN